MSSNETLSKYGDILRESGFKIYHKTNLSKVETEVRKILEKYKDYSRGEQAWQIANHITTAEK